MVLILALLLVLILFGAGFAVHLCGSRRPSCLFSGWSDSPLVGVRELAVTGSIGGSALHQIHVGRCNSGTAPRLGVVPRPER